MNIEPGRYLARAVDAGLGKAGTGADQIAVAFEIKEGDHVGTRLTWYGFFSDKSIDSTLKALRLCGWTGDDISDLSGICDNDVHIVVELEADLKGALRPRIRWINDPNGSPLGIKQALDAGQTRSLADRIRGRAIESRSKQAAAPIDPDCPFAK